MLNNIKKLKEYEEQGCLFHGSPNKFDVLIPQQPFSYDKKIGKMIEHGNTCVAATPFLNIAIFRALVNRKNAPNNHRSSFGYSSDKSLEFKMSRRTFSQIKNKEGFIYVLRPEGFQKFSSMERRIEKEVKPIDVVNVDFKNLPKSIEII